MDFVNEYEMDMKRYVNWSTPVLWRVPIFYIYMAVMLVSIYAWWYFAQHDVAMRWQTLAAFMALICFYRGALYGKMAANKHYRITEEDHFKDGHWMCKVEVGDAGVRVSANGKMNSYVKWDRVTSFQEAKSFYDLKVGSEQARLDKNSFTKGDAESFKAYMLEKHADIPYSEVEPRWNR